MTNTFSYSGDLAATIYITTCVIMAAIRWFHMCRPYEKDPYYYFPGRPFVTALGLNALFLIPYAICPENHNTHYLVRFYFLPVTLYHFTILLFSYFGNVMHWKKWRVLMIITGLPVALALIAFFVLTVWPNKPIEGIIGSYTASCIIYALGVIMTVGCIYAIIIVYNWAKRFDEDVFSNPADFPVVAARKWLTMVLVNIILCWSAALSGSRLVMELLILFLAVSMIIFLITALHPHRNRPCKEDGEIETIAEEDKKEDKEEVKELLYQRSISQTKRKEILSAIRVVVEKQEAYLDPHLTLQDVADRSGYNRSYVAGLIKSEYGGFFSYVNTLRLKHVESYHKDHPTSTMQESLEASGFNSRQSYYAVLHRMNKS
ncbi:MAG: hypothetical protein IKZ50_06850 [Bacteroidales bacterium]|nr:hypothetical protein [Bacteroidales bacterium]